MLAPILYRFRFPVDFPYRKIGNIDRLGGIVKKKNKKCSPFRGALFVFDMVNPEQRTVRLSADLLFHADGHFVEQCENKRTDPIHTETYQNFRNGGCIFNHMVHGVGDETA